MLPWMHRKEIDLVKSYLHTSYKMFEWGCGGSTLYFSEYVRLYRSIEHNLQWFQKIKPQIKENTELYHINNSNDYKDYINAISLYEDSYDVILVDGRHRVSCSIKAKEFLKKDGILLVHDFFKREYYFPIMKYYTLIDSITDTQQTLAVFKNEVHN